MTSAPLCLGRCEHTLKLSTLLVRSVSAVRGVELSFWLLNLSIRHPANFRNLISSPTQGKNYLWCQRCRLCRHYSDENLIVAADIHYHYREESMALKGLDPDCTSTHAMLIGHLFPAFSKYLSRSCKVVWLRQC